MKIKYKITENNCWECYSHKPNNFGYPVIKINDTVFKIYRLYYEKYKGVIPENLVVRHTCDNTFCINPDHLILGTHSDNVEDRVERNRSALGIKNGRSKLSEAEVLNIFNSFEPTSTLSKIYKVDPKTIRNIKNKKNWKHVLK